MVSKRDTKLNPNKFKVIIELILPSSIKEIQRILNHIEWYCEVIYNYITIYMPIIRF